jgi:hypothetical protein
MSITEIARKMADLTDSPDNWMYCKNAKQITELWKQANALDVNHSDVTWSLVKQNATGIVADRLRVGAYKCGCLNECICIVESRMV